MLNSRGQVKNQFFLSFRCADGVKKRNEEKQGQQQAAAAAAKAVVRTKHPTAPLFWGCFMHAHTLCGRCFAYLFSLSSLFIACLLCIPKEMAWFSPLLEMYSWNEIKRHFLFFCRTKCCQPSIAMVQVLHPLRLQGCLTLMRTRNHRVGSPAPQPFLNLC